MIKRHFPYKHPSFSTEDKPKSFSHVKVSVYYWWYEYLKRNVDYRNTCQNKGIGKCSALYDLFGDVHDISFRQWWTKDDRGAVLFAEPFTPTIRLIDPDIIGVN